MNLVLTDFEVLLKLFSSYTMVRRNSYTALYLSPSLLTAIPTQPELLRTTLFVLALTLSLSLDN